MNNTTYTATFTVTEGGTDVVAGSDIPISVTVTDSGGNASAAFTTAISQAADPIDANTPSITSVTVPNTGMKVGDVVTATITVPSDADDYTTGAGAIAGNIGGFALGGFAKVSNTSYTATFTVTEGGTDVAAGTDIPISVTVTDSGGNTSAAFATAISQAGDPIDANTPAITSVSIPDVPMNVGDPVVTITVPTDTDDYTTGAGGLSGNVGGFPLGGFAKVNDTTYTASFTVTEGGTDVPAGTDIPVNFTIADSGGNTSAPFTTAISQANDPIDANSPLVTDANISLNMTTFLDGDTLTATWDNTGAGDNNPDIAMGGVTMDLSAFGLSAVTAPTNAGGMYTATGTINLPAGGTPLNVSVTATDTGGNVTTTADTTNATVGTPGPTLTIGPPSTTTTGPGPVNFTVTYVGATGVTLAANNVTLNSTGTATGTVQVSGTGTTSRNVSITGITGDGTLGISLAAGTAVDVGANPAPAAGPSATFEVLNTIPEITIGAPSSTITSTGPVTFMIDYANADAISLTNGNVTLIKTGTATGTVSVSGSGTAARTVTISNITGDGMLSISIAAGTASADVGTTAAAAGPSGPIEVVSASTVVPVPMDGAVVLDTTGNGGGNNPNPGILHAVLVSDPNGPPAQGFATISSPTSDAVVPGTPERTSGDVSVEFGPVTGNGLLVLGQSHEDGGAVTSATVNTGLAISNSTTTSATISFTIANHIGAVVVQDSFTLPAGEQIAAFLNEAPFNVQTEIQGTLTFTSTAPIGVLALRGVTNRRSEFLFSTLPVADSSSTDSDGRNERLPLFVEGLGWTTQVVLTNSSNSLQTGSLRFIGQGGAGVNAAPLEMTINGVTASEFNYSIPAGSTVRYATSGTSTEVTVGSVEITSDVVGPFTSRPFVYAILSMRSGGIIVNETSMAAEPLGTGFRVFVESFSGSGDNEWVQSGVAMANTSADPNGVVLKVTTLEGTPIGVSRFVSLPPNGQISMFINELLPNIPDDFRGLLQVTAESPIAITAIRGRYSDRGDFIFSTTPATNNDIVPSSSRLVFPHWVNGGGFTTTVVVFGQPGASTGSTIVVKDQGGQDAGGDLAPLSVEP